MADTEFRPSSMVMRGCYKEFSDIIVVPWCKHVQFQTVTVIRLRHTNCCVCPHRVGFVWGKSKDSEVGGKIGYRSFIEAHDFRFGLPILDVMLSDRKTVSFFVRDHVLSSFVLNIVTFGHPACSAL